MPANMAEETYEARDRTALTRKQLLADYSAISKKRRGAAEATAIRLQSRQYLDILAAEATHADYDWVELRRILSDASDLKQSNFEPMVMAEIGRVMLLQQLEADDDVLGMAALEYGIDTLPANLRTRRFRKLCIEQLILGGDTEAAEGRLDEWPDVDREFHGYLRAEISNPFHAQENGDLEAWLENFNRPFRLAGLDQLEIEDGEGSPFDRLRTTGTAIEGPAVGVSEGSAPIVSVILTTFNPARAELTTSLTSILRQTLRDIEIVIVDDGSGTEARNLIDHLAEQDDRIKVVHAVRNGGTYKARNIGLSASSGEYVTGQDDDDWSHPARLAEQVEFMESHPEVSGCRIESITCLPDLSRLRLGYKAYGANASSLMMHRRTFALTGGYLEARKAADTELHRRAEKLTGRPIADIAKPLAIVRIAHESLSRSDFRAGWSHPARRQFKSSYTHWHATATRSELTLAGNSAPMLNIPTRFRVDGAVRLPHLDVVLAGDWRQYGGPQKSMIEEIRALVAHGFKVGVMQLEAPRFMTKVLKPLTPHVQQLINDGTVEEVLYDDEVNIDLLVLRYPPILQFAPDAPSRLRVRRMAILANQAPSEMDGTDIRYLVSDCTENARSMFTDNVTWVPQGPQVREAISPYLATKRIEPFDMPGIVNPEEWKAKRTHLRSTLPVVGRHSRDNRMKWPEEASVINDAYPRSGRFDIRILGGAGVPLSVLGVDDAPAAWTVYEVDALPVPAFLRSLDYYVFFQNSVAVEAFGRSILEAIASGLIVILPKSFEEVFGEAAIYVLPNQVSETIMKYHNDAELHRKQLETAAEVVADRFSHESYVRLVESMIGGRKA